MLLEGLLENLGTCSLSLFFFKVGRLIMFVVHFHNHHSLQDLHFDYQEQRCIIWHWKDCSVGTGCPQWSKTNFPI